MDQQQGGSGDSGVGGTDQPANQQPQVGAEATDATGAQANVDSPTTPSQVDQVEQGASDIQSDQIPMTVPPAEQAKAAADPLATERPQDVASELPMSPAPPAPAPVDISTPQAHFISGDTRPKMPRVSVKFAAIVLIVMTTLAGAFYYLKTINKAVEKQIATTSRLVSKVELQEVYSNPFDRETQYVNPFEEFKNPFYQVQ